MDLNSITYAASSTDLRRFKETSKLTEVRWERKEIIIHHTKLGQWKPPALIQMEGQPPAEQEATLYLGRLIGGRWLASGVERWRPGQTRKSLGQPFDMIEGWMHNEMWRPLNSAPMAEGELVFFCLASGNHRLATDTEVWERTDIRMARVYRDRIELVETATAPSQPEAPTGQTPGAPLDSIPRLMDRVKACEDANTTTNEKFDKRTDILSSDLARLESRADELEQRIFKLERGTPSTPPVTPPSRPPWWPF